MYVFVYMSIVVVAGSDDGGDKIEVLETKI